MREDDDMQQRERDRLNNERMRPPERITNPAGKAISAAECPLPLGLSGFNRAAVIDSLRLKP